MTDLPEVTDVQRLALQPGDVLVAIVQTHLAAATAERVGEKLRACFGAEIPIVVLDQGMRLAVVNKAELEAQR